MLVENSISVELPVKGIGISDKFEIKRVDNRIEVYCL